MNGQGTQLVLPDGVTITVTDEGYKCASMPSLAKVLDFLYPVNQMPGLRAHEIGANYGWRVRDVEKVILARNNDRRGVGV